MVKFSRCRSAAQVHWVLGCMLLMANVFNACSSANQTGFEGSQTSSESCLQDVGKMIGSRLAITICGTKLLVHSSPCQSHVINRSCVRKMLQSKCNNNCDQICFFFCTTIVTGFLPPSGLYNVFCSFCLLSCFRLQVVGMHMVIVSCQNPKQQPHFSFVKSKSGLTLHC